jgi:hypothetical protein
MTLTFVVAPLSANAQEADAAVCSSGGTAFNAQPSIPHAYWYSEANPDLIVTDMRMLAPQVNGYAATEVAASSVPASNEFGADDPIRLAFMIRPQRAGVPIWARYTGPDGQVTETTPFMSDVNAGVFQPNGITLWPLTADRLGWNDLPPGAYTSEVLVDGVVGACVEWSILP